MWNLLLSQPTKLIYMTQQKFRQKLIHDKLLVLFAILLSLQSFGQNKFTISGTVKDKHTGELLVGASVKFNELKGGTVTNSYGFFSITLPQNKYTLIASYVGYKAAEQAINLSASKDIVLELTSLSALEEVIVVNKKKNDNVTRPLMGVEKLDIKMINQLPVLLGERDVLKSIQLLPGIKSAGEGNSGFYVRGGGADQNLILLDEAPVYNASHLLGFFSTFNSDAIKNVTLYKGTMPAQYGGRLSSVLDIKMNDGNNQDFAVSGGIGLIASRLNLEGPLQKDKSSFLVSARRTYADVFLKLGDSSLKKTKLYFYDLNAKMNFILGEKDKIFLSGYFGRDVLSQDKVAGINWGNATGTLRWNHIFNKKLFSNTSLIYSNYDYKINVHTESIDYGILSRIRDWNLKEELQLYANANNTVTFGINSIYHTIKPGEISVTDKNGTVTQGLQDRYSLDNAIYANDSWRINNKWDLTYGLRISAFTILGKGDYYTLDDTGKVIDTIH